MRSHEEEYMGACFLTAERHNVTSLTPNHKLSQFTTNTNEKKLILNLGGRNLNQSTVRY